MKIYFFFSLLLVLSFSLLAEEKEVSREAKEQETIDFRQIKDVLKKDQLDHQAAKKTEEVKKVVEEKKKVDISRYDIPAREQFWGFFSELWLVKNAPVLKWDFQKPDYGLNESFASFLESRGHFERRFKILMVDTPSLSHFALPSNPGQDIYVLSLPFIRTLDLSKTEISLLLFENFLRLKMGYFEKMATTKDLSALMGTNFAEKKLEKKVFEDILKKYDNIIFDSGFNFEQQFEITKQMNEILKADLNLWNSYVQLLKKIDELVKSNVLYNNYTKIYPSPELQLGWLIPKEKRP